MAAEPAGQGREAPPSGVGSEGAPTPAPNPPPASTSAATGPAWLWAKIKRHKVVEWTLAYVAFAYAFLHGAEMLSDAQDWPHAIVRVLSLALILGVPMVALLAWYHGHRAQHRISGPEIVLLTLLLFVTGSMLWWLSIGHLQRAAGSRAPTALPSSTIASNSKSIAVLSFLDPSQNHDQGPFADGLAEEILTLLAKVPDLKVISRASSFSLRRNNEDARQIGNELGAHYLLEGSIRPEGGNIRLTAEVIDASNGTDLWSEAYDRPLPQTVEMQSELAAAIARQIQLSVGFNSEGQSVPNINNADAYEDFLRGMRMLDRYDAVGYAQADTFLRSALARDPSFLSAREQLAFSHYSAAAHGFLDARAGFDLASREAAELLKIDPVSSIARGILGQVALSRFDWAEAQRQLALAAPNDSVALFGRGSLASALGRWDEAINYYNIAVSVNPLKANPWRGLGFALYRAGRSVEAEAALRHAVSITPTIVEAHAQLGFVLLARGQPTAALEEIQKDSDPTYWRLGRLVVFHALGKTDEAGNALAELLASGAERHAFRIAQAFAFLGRKDEAFNWLDRAYRQEDEGLPFIKGEWLLRNLEADPRYKAFLRKMNLPE